MTNVKRELIAMCEYYLHIYNELTKLYLSIQKLKISFLQCLMLTVCVTGVKSSLIIVSSNDCAKSSFACLL